MAKIHARDAQEYSNLQHRLSCVRGEIADIHSFTRDMELVPDTHIQRSGMPPPRIRIKVGTPAYEYLIHLKLEELEEETRIIQAKMGKLTK